MRRTETLGLPVTSEWGRWKGHDRAKRSLEMDIVAPLLDGRVMTGGVTWNTTPVPAERHYHHMEMIARLADAGVQWAHAAAQPDAPLLWVAAGGFSPEFEAAARKARREVHLWSLEELYG